MDDKAIDLAIFSMLSEMAGYRKAVAVVSRVAGAFADDLPDAEAAFHTVANRIEALVGDGRLVA